MCACGVLSVSGSLAIPSNGAERGRLTRFNFPGFLDLGTSWLFNCRPSNCMVA